MATISNIKGLEYGGTELISTRAQNAITFDVADAPTGYYCEVSIGGYAFRCVNTTANSWAIDMTDILSSLLGLPPTTVTVEGLTKLVIPIINVYTSTGGTALVSATVYYNYLCFGYPKKGVSGGMAFGDTLPRYHNGKYCFYSGSGVYTISTNKTDQIYKPVVGSEIAWIDSTGGWSFWNFRFVSETIQTKNSKEVEFYALRNVDAVMSSYDLESETKSELLFDTVAVDATHFKFLTEIQRSKRIIYNGRVYRVKDISETTAAYRQNLHFKITLETKENA
jgi:hypothetical protein